MRSSRATVGSVALLIGVIGTAPPALGADANGRVAQIDPGRRGGAQARPGATDKAAPARPREEPVEKMAESARRRPAAAPAVVELNSASPAQLREALGLTEEQLLRIISRRPYRRPEDLMQRNVVPKSVYDRIKDQITVTPPAPPPSPPGPIDPRNRGGAAGTPG